MKNKILVTGFEPYGLKGNLFKRNESKEIALRLKKKYPSLEILILPVKDSCVQILVSKIESYKPDIIIGMGQSDWKLRIESMCSKGDKMLYSKFAEEIKAKLKFVYDDIGTYYCNDVYRKERYDKKFDKDIIENNKWRGDIKIDLNEYEKMYGEFKSCKSISENRINIEKLEELVWYSLFDFLSRSEEVKKEYRIRYEKNLEGKERFEGKLRYYEIELKKLDERRYNFLNKWLDGKVGDEDKKIWEERNEKNIGEIRKKIKLTQETGKVEECVQAIMWELETNEVKQQR
jgi:hypothetical protein